MAVERDAERVRKPLRRVLMMARMVRFVVMPLMFAAATAFTWTDRVAAQAETGVQLAPPQIALAVTSEDRAAVASLISIRAHLMLAQTPAASHANRDIPALKLSNNARSEIINSLPSIIST